MLLLAFAGGDPALAGEPSPANRSPTAAAEGLAAADGDTLEPPNKSASKSMLLAGPFPANVGVPVLIWALVVPPLVPMPMRSSKSYRDAIMGGLDFISVEKFIHHSVA